MRVVNVEIPADNHFGLKEIRMSRLGKVVVLAGKNGAGKTRILDRLAAWNLEKAFSYTNRFELKQAFYSATKNPTFNRENVSTWFLKKRLIQYSEKSLAAFYNLEFDPDGRPNFVFFVPKVVKLINQDG